MCFAIHRKAFKHIAVKLRNHLALWPYILVTLHVSKLWTHALNSDICIPLQTFLVSQLHEVVHFSTTMVLQLRLKITVLKILNIWVNFQNMKMTKSRDTKNLQLNYWPFRIIEKSLSKVNWRSFKNVKKLSGRERF